MPRREQWWPAVLPAFCGCVNGTAKTEKTNMLTKAPERTVPVPLLDLKAQFAQIETEVRQVIQEVAESGTYVLGPRAAGGHLWTVRLLQFLPGQEPRSIRRGGSHPHQRWPDCGPAPPSARSCPVAALSPRRDRFQLPHGCLSGGRAEGQAQASDRVD